MSYPQTLVTMHMEDARKIALGMRGKFGKYLSPRAVNEAFNSAMDREALCFYLPHISFCVDWDKLMATKSPDFNLIDYRLDDAQLSEFDTWIAKQAGDPTEILIQFATSGYKISLTYVENSQAWCCSITGKDEAKFNTKTTLTSWADEPLEALYMAAFKVFVVFKGGKWQTKTQSRRG